MLGWAITFLIVAVCAAFLGFGDIAGTAISATKLIFLVALLLFAVSMTLRLVRRGFTRG